jgi:hypothetical protein
MESAIFGLLGVIVGGTITAGTNYFFARRHEKAELKKASRLVDADLLMGQTAANFCVEKRQWWDVDIPIATEAWQKWKGVLAAELTYDAWLDVQKAVLAVDNLRTTRGAVTGDISDSVAAQIVPILQDIKAGRFALVLETPLRFRR